MVGLFAAARQIFFIVLLNVLLLSLLPPKLSAQIKDPFDPFDEHSSLDQLPTEDNLDQYKTPNQLIQEAFLLQQDDRLLDARTKLLLALKKDPLEYRAHILLADYYLKHVGHFRLAFKYAKRALTIFKQKNGNPPYSDPRLQLYHMDLLNLMSSIKLNLDDYQGALDELDRFESYGYYEAWIPASRAWILMKLGRLDEAIRVARIGLLTGAAQGHTLNILGILLSMTNEKESSLKIFEQAIKQELSLGKMGSPATPLNNSGEVYKELFQEDLARKSWLKAVRLPDGCEHVLPSLNLALLYIEEADYAKAKEAIDNFEGCIAQFPLRNGEEHRALVELARGRIAMHSGFIDDALKHLENALDQRQWFGKIGTSQADLQAAAMISLAGALKKKNNLLRLHRFPSLLEKLKSLKTMASNSLKAWWLYRRARQILTEDLSDLEDLYIRHTDSMIEYPSLGEALAGFRWRTLRKRINVEEETDHRLPAYPYYLAYLAENLIAHSQQSEARQMLDEALQRVRPRHDTALEVHLTLLKMRLVDETSAEYRKLSYQVFEAVRSQLRNYGFRLPVNYSSMPQKVKKELNSSAFLLNNSEKLLCSVSYEFKEQQHLLRFSCSGGPLGGVTVKAGELREAVNSLSESVFTKEL